jgi:carboxylesterase 1
MWEPHYSFGGYLFYSVARNPNGKGLPHWPQYDQKEGYLEIGTTTQAAEKLKDKEVAFWTELLTKKSPEIEHTEL